MPAKMANIIVATERDRMIRMLSFTIDWVFPIVRCMVARDLTNLLIIHRLVKEEGMTLAGVKRKLNGKWDDADKMFEIRESLQKIKNLLLELRDNI